MTVEVAASVPDGIPTENASQIQKMAHSSITLLPLEQLQTLVATRAAECVDLQKTATANRAAADDKLADAGAALVESRTDWHGVQQDSELVASAAALVEQLRADDASLDELEQHKPTGLRHIL